MASTVEITVSAGLATLRLGREHGNAINAQLADELAAACREAEADDGIRGVLLASRGRLFCPGLDLRELIELDRGAMEAFVGRFNGCVRALYALSKPVVAAIGGHALAGGCVLALAADRRVLREGARIGLNEVRVGVPFPFGVALILRECVPRAWLEEIVLLGNNYAGDEARRVGLVHELHPAAGFEEHCASRLAEFCSRDLAALRVTKRYLRSAVLERICAAEAAHVGEFLDGWFRAETRARIREIVDELRAR